jgi:hypothetical protein
LQAAQINANSSFIIAAGVMNPIGLCIAAIVANGTRWTSGWNASVEPTENVQLQSPGTK